MCVHDIYGLFSQINSQYNFQQQSKNVYDAVLTIQKETRLWNSFEIFQKKNVMEILNLRFRSDVFFVSVYLW